MALSVVPSELETFAAANTAAGKLISSVGSADPGAMLSAAAAAIGPIGATYLAEYCPAQANNLAGTVSVGAVHTAIGAAADASRTSFVAADSV
jgi:hypothetical protein